MGLRRSLASRLRGRTAGARPIRRCGAFTFASGLALLAAAPCARAQAPTKLSIQEELASTGDVQSRFVLQYAPSDYQALKKSVPHAEDIALAGIEADPESVVTEATGVYDDRSSSAVISILQAGAARNRGGGRWEYSAEMDDSTVALVSQRPDATGRITFTFAIAGGVSGSGRISLPAGATEATWEPARSVVGYTLARPLHASGAPRLDLSSFEVNSQILSAAYKVYGDRTRAKRQWTGKTVFKNNGTVSVEALRVRYRLAGYSEWSSFERITELVPGQTVVSTYYPQIDSKIAQLRSSANAAVEVEWTYRDSAGRDVTEGDSKSVQLLGGNQLILSRRIGAGAGRVRRVSGGVFDSAELLGAWFTPEDPVVREFASWASKRAAGAVVSPTDDTGSLLLLKNIYELWLTNDMTYQNPSGFGQVKGGVRDGAALKSFDETQIQIVKFPRDTIKDRSGTCIETAVLFASMASAVGLRAGIALIPGHAFPFAIGASGKAFGVESTRIGGGNRLGNLAQPFEDALAEGTTNLGLVQKGEHPSGQGVLVTIDQARSMGIFPPETEPPPPNALQVWGLRIGEAGDQAGLGDPSGEWAGAWIAADARERPLHILVDAARTLQAAGPPVSCQRLQSAKGSRSVYVLECSSGEAAVFFYLQFGKGLAEGEALRPDGRGGFLRDGVVRLKRVDSKQRS